MRFARRGLGLLALGLAGLAARASAGPTAAPRAPGLEHAAALDDFTGKLRELSAGRRHRVSIVHLGDSHIQGELLTGPIRRRLQSRFGAAGRGVVVPWDAAGTNGPGDFTSVSDADWNLSRVPAPDAGVPPGVAGMTVWTRDGGFLLKLGVRGEESSDRFDRIALLAEGGPGWTGISLATHPDPMILESSRAVTRDLRHTVRKGDTLYGIGRRWGCTVAQLRKWNRLPSNLIHPGKGLIVRRVTGRRAPVDRTRFMPGPRFDPPPAPGPFMVSVDLPELTDHLYLRGSGTATGSARLYGILLDRRDTPGVVYHSIGVNGAEVRDFNTADLFWHQLPLLEPDLVVVTLGANDAAATDFVPERFRAQVDDFLDRLAALPGRIPVLLMSPPDQRGPRGRRLPSAGLVREIIHDAARRRGTACWDATAAMGGDGAVAAWKQRGWAGPDLVHLTPEGYRKLADLLVDDLLRDLNHPTPPDPALPDAH